MANLFDLASFDSYVYQPSKRNLLPTDSGTWNSLRTPTKMTDGFYAQAFQNAGSHEIVIAIRGTIPSFSNDIEDLQLAEQGDQTAAHLLNAYAQLTISFATQVAINTPGAGIDPGSDCAGRAVQWLRRGTPRTAGSGPCGLDCEL